MGKQRKKNNPVKKKQDSLESQILRRRTLHVKYATQYPFRAISRTPSGKNLLLAQRLWRDGTALFEGLGLPVTFKVEEIDNLLKGASLKEKNNIFELCGQAILCERVAVDTDITDILLLKGLYLSGTRCDSFHAHVVNAFVNEFLYLNSLNTNKADTLAEIQQSYRRALGKEPDPRLTAMYGRFLMMYEGPRAVDQEDPYKATISQFRISIETFEHRLPNYKNYWDDGTAKFDVYFTMASVLHKKVAILLTNKNHLVKVTPKIINDLGKDYRLSLELYLNKAPKCHWNYPHASFMLSTEWIMRKTPPTGAKLKEILSRNQADVENSIKLFDQGVESVKTLVKWNPHENLAEKEEYKEAKRFQEVLLEEGFRKTPMPALPISKVELREALDEEDLSWGDWFRWNLTDSRNIQLIYLFLFLGILLDPLFNMFGFFIKKEEKIE